MTREQLRGALKERLSGCNAVLAMWEAGSAAFDRADDLSDVDIGVLAKPDSLEAVWAAVEAGLDDVGGFSIRWENPVHVFKGMTQRVYRPTNAPPCLDLDIGVFQEPADDLYLQKQRHGQAHIFFDRTPDQRTANASFDEAAHAQRMREALHQEIMRWNLYRDFVSKEHSRGRTIDAFGFYVAFAVRPVLNLLGMLHRPDRFDYGFRYLKEELPPGVVNQIERLCYVASPDQLPERVEEATVVVNQTLEALRQAGVTPLDAKGVDRI